MKIANNDRPSFIAELSNVLQISSVEKVNKIVFFRSLLHKHGPPTPFRKLEITTSFRGLR